MWVRFKSRFDFSPEAKGGRVTVVYRGGVHNVPRECADRAIALGVAVKVKSPKAKVDLNAEE